MLNFVDYFGGNGNGFANYNTMTRYCLTLSLNFIPKKGKSFFLF